MAKHRNSSTKPAQMQQLRIIGGQWRGRKLSIANVPGLRPTGDRIRETLFNWLMADLPGSHCLDLFAGSGALGLESLSRGAQKVIMLEQNPLAIRQLQQHCQQLQAEAAEVIAGDTLSWLASKPLPKHSINIVFMDPPFTQALWQTVINQLQASELLETDAMIYIEAPKGLAMNTPDNWRLFREKQAGEVSYQLYQCQ